MLAISPRRTCQGAATSPARAGRPAASARTAWRPTRSSRPAQAVVGQGGEGQPGRGQIDRGDHLAARDRPGRHRHLDQFVDPAGGGDGRGLAGGQGRLEPALVAAGPPVVAQLDQSHPHRGARLVGNGRRGLAHLDCELAHEAASGQFLAHEAGHDLGGQGGSGRQRNLGRRGGVLANRGRERGREQQADHRRA